MSNFNHIPDDSFAMPSGSFTERVCQTCAYCTWDNGTKCIQPAVLGLESDTARFGGILEHGVNIRTAYRLCNGEHWKEQDWEE